MRGLSLHYKRLGALCILFAHAASLVKADLFDWDTATITKGILTFETQPEVRFILGHHNRSNVREYSILLVDGQGQQTVLIDKFLAQGLSDIQTQGDTIVIESEFEPRGQDGLTTVRQCWRFDPVMIAWTERICPE